MTRLTIDELMNTLPALDELAPLRRLLLARSLPDPTREWAGSGELGTSGTRLVELDSLATLAAAAAADEAAHLARLYTGLAEATAALADGRYEEGARALLEVAELEADRDRGDRCEAYAGAAYTTARKGDDAALTALALRRWGRAARARGRLDEASDRYQGAFGIAEVVGDRAGAAEAALGAGNVLWDQGLRDEAEAWYERALEALSTRVDPTPQKWHALLNLHIVHRSRGDLEASVGWLEQAEQVADEVDREAAVPFLENAWGQLRMAESDFTGAEEHFRRALGATADARARITIRINLAEALLARGRALDAGVEAREAELDAIRTSSIPRLPEVYRLLGRVLSHEGNRDAFVFFERGLEIVREHDLPKLEEALLLQEYGAHERRHGEAKDAHELRELARDGLASLGIRHFRDDWADVYASDTPTERDDSNPQGVQDD